MSFKHVLKEHLDKIQQDGLLRRLFTIDSPQEIEIFHDGKRFLNFSSNDYLGLANHPVLCEAVEEAVRQYGVGSGASRLVSGDLRLHRELEECLANFKGTESALVFSSGYATALGVIPALIGKGDVVILDKLCHACLVDGARLSGATLRVYRHNDLNQLEHHLEWARERARIILIVSESVFSMDGDLAPLKQLVKLKEQYGAWLLVDEAHATGLYGRQRAGRCQDEEVTEQVEIQMGTLSKAVGSAGGYIAGSHRLVQFLINKARSFVFSTAPSIPMIAAAREGLRIIGSNEGENRCNKIWERVKKWEGLATEITGKTWNASSPICPLMVGDESQAMTLASSLREKGFWVPAIRYPTVARGQARLRLVFSSEHTLKQLTDLKQALDRSWQEKLRS